MANGFNDEYMINGENTKHNMNIQPVGPIKYLLNGVLPRGFIFNISASHFD